MVILRLKYDILEITIFRVVHLLFLRSIDSIRASAFVITARTLICLKSDKDSCFVLFIIRISLSCFYFEINFTYV